MNCEKYQILLCGYIDNELSSEQQQDVGMHLQNCANCKREIDYLYRVQTLCRNYPIPLPSHQKWEKFNQDLFSKLPATLDNEKNLQDINLE